MNTIKLLMKLASIISGGAIINGLLVINIANADIDKLIKNCTECHGKDGASIDSDVPVIGGFSAQYMLDSMAAYKEKDRPCPEFEYPDGPNKGDKTDMCKIADDISEDDNKEIGKHFANKPFVRVEQKHDAALAAKGKDVHDKLCEKCHGDGGDLASDDAGILAGQWIPYLEVTFKDYESGDRKQPKKMKKKMKKLDADTTKQLIHFYGSFK